VKSFELKVRSWGNSFGGEFLPDIAARAESSALLLQVRHYFVKLLRAISRVSRVKILVVP
jgi:hypothetical protein